MKKNIGPDEVARIVEATKTGRNARKPDLATLARGIEQCANWYLEAKHRTFRNYQLLSPIIKTAKRLDQLLADQRIPLSGIEGYRTAIKTLVQESDTNLRRSEDGPGEAMLRDLSNRSPFDWIAGNFLADVYELNFQQKATYSVDGPFVRFTEAALNVLQITNEGRPYSRSSISKARKDDLAGTIRRKPTRLGTDNYRFWRRGLLIQAFSNQEQKEAE